MEQQLEALLVQHKLYCDFNQKEDVDSAFMAANAHPETGAYKELREFFDSLKYACNSGARIFSWSNYCERTEYWKPTLEIGNAPKTDALAKFYNISPSNNLWGDYLKASAQAGWPDDVAPKLYGGRWLIRTSSTAFAHDVVTLCDRELGTGVVKARTEKCQGSSYTTIDICVFERMTVRLHRMVEEVIRMHHADQVQPMRTQQDEAADVAELPLSQKSFRLARVKELTITARAILVPIVPFGEKEKFLHRLIADVLLLVEQGLPFGQVKGWLQRFLTNEALRRIESRFNF